MKKNITIAWKRVKDTVEQNKSLQSVLFTLFCIFLGGILATIGVAIFQPTYVYPSIRIFIATYLAGGILFTMGLAAISIIIVLLNMIKENPKILFSENMIIRYMLLLIAIILFSIK